MSRRTERFDADRPAEEFLIVNCIWVRDAHKDSYTVKHCRMSQRGIEEICPGHHGHEAGSSIVLLAVPLVEAFAKGLYSLLGGVDPQQHYHRQYGQLDAGGRITHSNGDADRRQNPYTGCGGDAYDDAASREDNTGAQEADARNDLADQTKVWRRGVVEAGQRSKNARTDAYQDACSDADGLARYLPFKTNNCTGDHRTGQLGPGKR